MASNQKHIVILPYFCQEEVDRYLKIAQLLGRYPAPNVEVEFLLAASPRTVPSEELQRAFSPFGNTISFQCPTQVFGYPEGPGAMFWDCMEYIANANPGRDGFSLWLESDMSPVKPDWIDQLAQQWAGFEKQPIMMGCYVPEVYKRRLFKGPKLMLEPHINGGACYSLDFANQMPESARTGVFDMAVFQFAQEQGRAMNTSKISFSTNQRVRRDVLDPEKVLLHGFMQEKDQFIDDCVRPLTERERKTASLNLMRDKLETAHRRLKVMFVRKGRRAMLENMFLAKRQFEKSARERSLPMPVKRPA